MCKMKAIILIGHISKISFFLLFFVDDDDDDDENLEVNANRVHDKITDGFLNFHQE